MNLVFVMMKYLPYVINAVTAIEATLGPGNGASKKTLVLNAVQAAAKSGESVPDAHVQAISTLIDSTVATLNTTKLLGFGK